MKNEALIMSWRHEEQIAHIHGWDFSHIQDRYAEEDDLPWDYRQVIETCLTKEARLLDLDTGGENSCFRWIIPGGRWRPLRNIRPTWPFAGNGSCPWGWLPARFGHGPAALPGGKLRYGDQSPRGSLPAGDFPGAEKGRRVRHPAGGAENDRALVELLLQPAPPIPFPNNRLKPVAEKFERAGFEILAGRRGLPAHPVLGRGGAGVVRPGDPLGIAGLQRGRLPGSVAAGPANPGKGRRNSTGTIHRFLLAARKK